MRNRASGCGASASSWGMPRPILRHTQVVALRQELQKLGWDDGRNIRIDVRFPGTDAGRARAILMELISLTPDVLVSNTNLVTEVVQEHQRQAA